MNQIKTKFKKGDLVEFIPVNKIKEGEILPNEYGIIVDCNTGIGWNDIPYICYNIRTTDCDLTIQFAEKDIVKKITGKFKITLV